MCGCEPGWTCEKCAGTPLDDRYPDDEHEPPPPYFSDDDA